MKQPRVRSWVAVAAHRRNSAGAMGGTPRAKNRRDRQAGKRQVDDFDQLMSDIEAEACIDGAEAELEAFSEHFRRAGCEITSRLR